MKVVPLGRTRLYSVMPALIVAAAYAVAGWLGLWLAIPPGYATAIWPASGIALAGVLMGGARVWPGIWLGSFVVNIGTALDTSNASALLASAAIPTSIGVGATLQALLGAALVRRYVGFPSALTRANEMGAFLLLGGPVSCLINATVVITTLAVSGQIPWALFAITWGTWWVGDTLGVVIVTTLVLSWLAEPRAIWRHRRLSVALPLMGALALAIIVFVYTSAQERVRLQLLFERQAETLAQTLQNSLDDYLDVLHAIKSFHASSGQLSRQGFRTFVQRELARHPGLQALSWDVRVPDERRQAYEQAVRREGFPNFQITEQTAQGELVRAAQRPEYITVTYIEPHKGNEPVLGFDVALAPDRREALQGARDTGQPAATGRLTLVQERGDQFGLLVFLPVYGRGLPHATVEERRQSLQGYVTGVFRIGDMLKASLQGLEREGHALWIEDEAAPAERRMLYVSRSQALEGQGPTLDKPLEKHPTGMY
jgi:CHASE1-domain containing sensor protein